MSVKYTYAKDTTPLAIATIENGKGYWDLLVNKSKNGNAIRISNRIGEDSVNVSMDKVDALIEALNAIKARGVKTSVQDIPYTARNARTAVRR